MNVDFVPFIRGVRVLCKPRLIFSRINGPIVKNMGYRVGNESEMTRDIDVWRSQNDSFFSERRNKLKETKCGDLECFITSTTKKVF